MKRLGSVVTSSSRFPDIDLTEWRSRLIDRFPRLFPDARPCRSEEGWSLICSGYPSVPDGWRRILERACERMQAAIAVERTADFVILDIKEKYGTIRLAMSASGISPGAQAAVELAVDLVETRSRHVCAHCGEPGQLWISGGWLSTCCDHHGEGRPIRQEPGRDDVDITTRFQDGKSVRSARRYVFADDCFVPAPVPDEE